MVVYWKFTQLLLYYAHRINLTYSKGQQRMGTQCWHLLTPEDFFLRKIQNGGGTFFLRPNTVKSYQVNGFSWKTCRLHTWHSILYVTVVSSDFLGLTVALRTFTYAKLPLSPVKFWLKVHRHILLKKPFRKW